VIRLKKKKRRRINVGSLAVSTTMEILLISPATLAVVAALLDKAEVATIPKDVAALLAKAEVAASVKGDSTMAAMGAHKSNTRRPATLALVASLLANHRRRLAMLAAMAAVIANQRRLAMPTAAAALLAKPVRPETTPAAVVAILLANLERPVMVTAAVALLANPGRPVTTGILIYDARATVDLGWSYWPYMLIFMSKARKSSSLTAGEARSSIGRRKEKRRQNRFTYIMSY